MKIALVAHDAKKAALVDWASQHQEILSEADIVATGTTGSRLTKAYPDWRVRRVKSGPLGGDQQIGSLIAEGAIDAVIFFVDPLSPMPHDVDVKALMRLAVVYDVPMACSWATADLVLEGLLGRKRRSA